MLHIQAIFAHVSDRESIYLSKYKYIDSYIYMCVLFLKCFCYVYSLSMIKRQICNYPSAKFIHFFPSCIFGAYHL